MPEIDVPVVYTPEINAIIANKKLQEGFSHLSWADEDLEAMRIFIRRYYYQIQKGICSYCRQRVSTQSALNCHVEHIVPKSKHLDFMFTPKNLCVICADCNQIKREQETLGQEIDTVNNPNRIIQYPRVSNSFKIVHPHFDNYNEHIVEINGFYLDQTDKGHFTIGACKLNRKLREFGWESIEINDAMITELMNRYLDEPDPLKRAAILQSLKRHLIFL
ncbi:hypothetical protein GCM10028803_05000 [Larkinella knui]|uniref:HNH endonuclease n=1 Tax=Larkinella knui TaxID=2025310 RepID=A0A3P1CKG0_9BACT|nr:HNH endonuclease signature motif containing protein [Larkinella knui]RRB13823.1 HNH endonuclease [Larkinella knui]